jgi:hypothetical protein
LNRRGLIDADFFDCLTQERPRKQVQIRSLKEFWLNQESISAEPVAPRASRRKKRKKADPCRAGRAARVWLREA